MHSSAVHSARSVRSYEWSELCPRLPLLRRFRYTGIVAAPFSRYLRHLPSPPPLTFPSFVSFNLSPSTGGLWKRKRRRKRRRRRRRPPVSLPPIWEILAFQARRHKQHNACNATFRTRGRPCSQGRRSCSMTFLYQRMIVRGRFVGEASFTSGATGHELLEFERFALAHVSDKFEQLIRSYLFDQQYQLMDSLGPTD